MLEPSTGGIPIAHSVLEAGGAGSRALIGAIGRRIAELSPGQVLEIVSAADGARIDALAWCHVTGHELVALLTQPDGTHFWIRKGAGEAADSAGDAGKRLPSPLDGQR